MEEIKGYLASPGWWFTAIAMGLLVNLASAYLKRPLDAWLSGVSTRWRARSEAGRARFDRRVALFRSGDAESRTWFRLLISLLIQCSLALTMTSVLLFSLAVVATALRVGPYARGFLLGEAVTLYVVGLAATGLVFRMLRVHHEGERQRRMENEGREKGQGPTP